MNNPFKSRIVRTLIIGWILAIVIAAIITIVTIHVNPSIVNEPMQSNHLVPEFRLHTNFITNFYGDAKTN